MTEAKADGEKIIQWRLLILKMIIVKKRKAEIQNVWPSLRFKAVITTLQTWNSKRKQKMRWNLWRFQITVSQRRPWNNTAVWSTYGSGIRLPCEARHSMGLLPSASLSAQDGNGNTCCHKHHVLSVCEEDHWLKRAIRESILGDFRLRYNLETHISISCYMTQTHQKIFTLTKKMTKQQLLLLKGYSIRQCTSIKLNRGWDRQLFNL